MTRKRFYFRLLSPYHENMIGKNPMMWLMFLTIIVGLDPPDHQKVTQESSCGWILCQRLFLLLTTVLRLVTADYKLKVLFFLYPLPFLALADLLCILLSSFC